MKRLFFSLFFCGLCVLTLSGCPNSGGGGGESGVGADAGGAANDDRWRQRVLETTLTGLQRLADAKSPDDCRQSAIQGVEQLNAWIQEEKAPAGWKVDPLAEKWVTIFDDLEEVCGPLEDVIRALKYPDKYQFAGDDLVAISGKMLRAAGKITPDFPPVMQQLKVFLDGQSRYISAVLGRDMKLNSQEMQQFVQMMVMSDLMMKRLATLGGSGRMAFASGRIQEDMDFQHPLRNTLLMDTGTLMEMLMLRDVSSWAQGTPTAETQTGNLENESVTDVTGVRNEVKISAERFTRAAAMFDWCVTNIALEKSEVPEDFARLGVPATPKLPREVLLTGRGTALERAWVFMLLARQQGLAAFLVKIPVTEIVAEEMTENAVEAVSEAPSETPAETVSPPADEEKPAEAASGEEKLAEEKPTEEKPAEEKPAAVKTREVKTHRYLVGIIAPPELIFFDPELGLVVADDTPWTGEGEDFRPEIVTGMLKVRAETPGSEMLERFWQKAGLVVKLEPEFFRNSVALIEGSPQYLSLRMHVLQQQLTGYDRAALTTELWIIADYLREKHLVQKENIQLWTYPYEVEVYRALNLVETPDGMMLFQTAEDEFRWMEPFMHSVRGGYPLWRGRMLHLKGVLTGRLSATAAYQRARLSEADLNTLTVNGRAVNEEMKAALRDIRVTASFFMGNISLALGNAQAADEYFQVHVLGAAKAGNAWISPTDYALGRVQELNEKAEAAVDWYESIPDNRQGKLRAALLRREVETPTE